MDTLIPTEIDWLSAYYGVFDAWDATFNFWITATFAVIVAVHAISKLKLQICVGFYLLYIRYSRSQCRAGLRLSLTNHL